MTTDQLEFHHTTFKNLNHGQGSETPQLSPLPVTKQYLSETSLQHTHSLNKVLSFGHTSVFFLPADAVSGCHCALTGYLQWGRRLSTAETVSKCPTLIRGLWKEPTSWVNSMKGHRAERPAWVFNYSIIFQIYGCATSSTVILGLGVPSNVQHIFLITFIQYSKLHRKNDKLCNYAMYIGCN